MNIQSCVKILTVDMITGGKLVEIDVAHYQNRSGKYYSKVIASNLVNFWAWGGAAYYQPEVQASGPYTAIRIN
jgi:hypothetical protein